MLYKNDKMGNGCTSNVQPNFINLYKKVGYQLLYMYRTLTAPALSLFLRLVNRSAILCPESRFYTFHKILICWVFIVFDYENWLNTMETNFELDLSRNVSFLLILFILRAPMQTHVQSRIRLFWKYIFVKCSLCHLDNYINEMHCVQNVHTK